MSSFLSRRPSAALVVSVVALIVALGGTAYAGGFVGKNSVGSKQLKNNAVTSGKIKNGAVTTKKIANGAVTAGKINSSGLIVPNALHANTADSATNATNASNASNAGNASNANTVGGLTVKKVDLELATSTTGTIFSGAGLTLTAVCDGSTHVGIDAQSADGNAELNLSLSQSTTSTDNVYNQFDGIGTSPRQILAPSDDEGTVDIAFGDTTGHAVSAVLGTDYDNAFNSGTNTHCGVFGTVTGG